ncbi:hypothetical protein L1887_58138 [Cichorium endivia]|nr:hypothetical protein L1887_58138 [Cichorium endivia]
MSERRRRQSPRGLRKGRSWLLERLDRGRGRGVRGRGRGELVGPLGAKTVGKELDDKDGEERDHGEGEGEGVVLEVVVETWRAELLDTRRQQVDEGGGDDNAGAKVLGKVKGFAVDMKAGYAAGKDGEERHHGRRDPNDKDGAHAETDGAGEVIAGSAALWLFVSHFEEPGCGRWIKERWVGWDGGEPSATEDEWVLLYVQQARIGGRGLRKVADQNEQIEQKLYQEQWMQVCRVRQRC